MTCKICDEAHRRELNNFVSEYVTAISNESAAVFAGAGLSIPSGELSWASLLRDEAKSIGLEIDKEDDYISVAQYIFNESGTRNTITKLIKNLVDKKGNINENHKVLASMPISKYWTTNYDTYIERALADCDKRVDVKRASADLASEIEDSDATIYKMHGDIGQPNSVVMIKDDYEIYDKRNELFVKMLQSDLLSNTFLFIGFSFDDPNLENILSKVRVMLEGNPRRHYCFFKRVHEDDPEFRKHEKLEEREFEAEYRRRKQALKIKDLLRYGIKAIVVNDYKEITDILQNIREKFVLSNIFISGAYSEIEEGNIRFEVGEDIYKSANQLCAQIGVRLYENNYKLLNCLGLGVGRAVITGVLNKLYEQKKRTLSDNVIIKPFPDTDKDEQKKAYRTEIIKQCGIAVFLFGNKRESGQLIDSPGVMEEYKIAKELGLCIIPVGCTGYSANKIWSIEKKNVLDSETFEPDYKDLYEKLNQADIGISELTEVVVDMIKLYIGGLSKH